MKNSVYLLVSGQLTFPTGRGTYPFIWGQGQEKTFIASEFERRVHGLNFTIDISVDEKDRLYGDDWPRLLGNSRFTLGVEAGTTILDITGRLKSRVEQYLDLRPNSDFNEVSEAVIRNLEGMWPIEQLAQDFLKVLHSAQFQFNVSRTL